MNIESTCHKCIIYNDHTKTIEEYISKNLSSCQYPEAKNNLNGLFNIIWDYYISEYKLMSSPIYLHNVNKYSEYVDDQNFKNRIFIEKISYNNFKKMLENDQKNIIDYCEAGKYKKMINDHEQLKKYNFELHTI
ncbi:2428_t:CDS:1 [Scutellospora calospora]|uniref:2428_t:CDS:1 n=1 Tax=Scutellospora calospora TaxID=85575 RepID=A0ACA9LAF1_9GLOM|nr:2428_t:CDS:1 [Scutellospora calospora]